MTDDKRDDFWCRDHKGRAFTYEEYMELVRDFHGFPAPGLMIGGPMVELARSSLGEGVLFDAVCETRSCLPDAVQLLTLCSLGNGWLRVMDSGRFALTLYDKASGAGVRVSLDPSRLEDYPAVKTWFFKLKPKKEQDDRALYGEIRKAGQALFKTRRVKVAPEFLTKHKLGAVAICPGCGEPYPSKHGGSCLHCQGEAYYKE